MAQLYWLKLYYEIIEDYKMVQLPDSTWRKAIELFLVAGIKNENGLLPSMEEIAFMLRTSTDDLKEHLDRLMDERVQIVVEVDGKLKIKNFEKRQAAMPKKEYVRRKREADSDYRYGWKSTQSGNTDDLENKDENPVKNYIIGMLDQTDPQNFKKTIDMLDDCEIVAEEDGKILIIPNSTKVGTWLNERFMPYKKYIINGSGKYTDMEVVM